MRQVFLRLFSLFLVITALSLLTAGVLRTPESFIAVATSAAKFSTALSLSDEKGKSSYPADNVTEESPETDTSLSVSSDIFSSETQSAVPEQALGKIVSSFFKPYNANTSYNNVYVNNKTSLTVNLRDELNEGIKWRIEKNGQPEVLIFHTHTTEGYMTEDRDYYTEADQSRTLDNQKNVVRVGEEIAAALRNAGIAVIHDRTVHDNPSYTGSYSRSLETVNSYLSEYPGIKVVLDIHRDAIAGENSDKIKPVVKVDGKNAAQIMIAVGCEDGAVIDHPLWRENFRFALCLQQTFEVYYPGLARAVHFDSKKYNQNVSTGALILEIGTDANTLDEAVYSGELAGKALGSLLNTLS